MAHELTSEALVKIAGGGSTGTGALWTPIEINAGGYDRALIVGARGAEAGTTKGQFSMSVYEASSSGGSYSLISGSLGTSGTSSTNTPLLVEVKLDGTNEFLKVYGTASTSGTSAIPVVASAVLYKGSRLNPPSQDLSVTKV